MTPSMTHWTEQTNYSVRHDCDMSRISGFDDHGQEHYIFIETGRGFRDRRDAAIERIMVEIERGHVPGEIKD